MLEVIFGWRVNPHFEPFPLLSKLFIFGGFIIGSSCRIMYDMQKQHHFATAGLCARIRTWPSCSPCSASCCTGQPFITLVMLPVLVVVSKAEEKDVLAQFGAEYALPTTHAGIYSDIFEGRENGMRPFSTGGALALTVMIFYSLCTLVAVVWPAPFLGFMNALFHGVRIFTRWSSWGCGPSPLAHFSHGCSA